MMWKLKNAPFHNMKRPNNFNISIFRLKARLVSNHIQKKILWIYQLKISQQEKRKQRETTGKRAC